MAVTMIFRWNGGFLEYVRPVGHEFTMPEDICPIYNGNCCGDSYSGDALNPCTHVYWVGYDKQAVAPTTPSYCMVNVSLPADEHICFDELLKEGLNCMRIFNYEFL
jgi:hypothetical protein